MKALRVLTYVFFAIGLSMLAGGLYWWNSTRNFIATARTAPGTVVELVEVEDSDGGRSTWKPVVSYSSLSGETITFTTSFSTYPPAYDVGETVEVLYSPEDAHGAKIKGYSSLWLGPTIIGILGAVFASAGGGIYLARLNSQRKKEQLLLNGRAIETDVQGVERNTALKINGKHPWRITSQWLDPASNKLRVFHSENLWFDPTRFVTRKQVTVRLDPANPKRYHMDVSFLPELDDA